MECSALFNPTLLFCVNTDLLAENTSITQIGSDVKEKECHQIVTLKAYISLNVLMRHFKRK